MKKTFTYPIRSLIMDFVRGGMGLAIAGLPLALLELGWVTQGILGAVFCLFGIFGWLTLQRARTTIVFSEEKIAFFPRGRTLAWAELSGLSLNYYTTRGERTDGWMQLVLKSGKSKLKIDSRLSGFTEITAHAHAAAKVRGFILSEVTRANFATLATRENNQLLSLSNRRRRG